MDGARVVRIEIDKDEDGKIDRWEYYGADQKLEKVGFSRANDGKEDAWSFAAPDGSIGRIEISTQRNGKVDRDRALREESARARRRRHRRRRHDRQVGNLRRRRGWRRSRSTPEHRGTPDRRLIYGANGSASLEVDSAGDGHFAPVSAKSPRP